MAGEPLKPAQREALLQMLRVVAQGELQAEQLRMRLGECHDFEPYETFQDMQGGPRSHSGCLTSYSLHRWMAEQPHNLACTHVEDVAAMLAPYEGQRGELRYDGFLNIVLPKDPSHLWLKDAILARGTRPVWNAGSLNKQMSPEVAYRLCQLFEAEIDVGRHLKFHRKSLLELGTPIPNICKFLDFKQGVCAGMGGLISPSSIRQALVDESLALTIPQCDALLRRINPSGACLAPFSEVAKALQLGPHWPSSYVDYAGVSMDSADSRYEPFGLNSSLALSPVSPLAGYQEPSSVLSPRRVSWNDEPKSPLKDEFALDTSLSGTDEIRSWASPRKSAFPQELPVAAKSLRTRLDLSPVSPDRKSLGAASTQASTADGRSPRSPQSFAFSPPRSWTAHATPPRSARALSPTSRTWAAPTTPLGERHRPARASSVPAGARATSPVRHSYFESPQSKEFMSMDASKWSQQTKFSHVPNDPFDQQNQSQKVLKAVAQQGSLDAHVEDSKALIPADTPLEAIFDTLDRFKKGYIADTDLWAFSQQYGGQLSFSQIGALIREVQLRRTRDFSAMEGRLSFRELGSLVLRAGTAMRDAMETAQTDEEARSISYLLRNSEPCPRCGIRIQRDADCAGCPTVKCSACGASFRCFAVLGDAPRYIPPLSVSTQYHLHRLIGVAGSTALELEGSRKELSRMPGRDLYCTLSSVFNQVAGGRLCMSLYDLRRAMLHRHLGISEQELSLLGHRYAKKSAVEVSFAEFARQLTPQAQAWEPY